LLTFLVQMDRHIDAVAQETNCSAMTGQLRNCVKIKFLRKALLAKSFKFTRTEYQKILQHPKFLKQ